MNPKHFLKELPDRLTGDFHNKKGVLLFLKTLTVFILLKVALLWPFTHQLLSYQAPTVKGSVLKTILLAPAGLAIFNTTAFFSLFLVVLIVLLIRKPAPWSAGLQCWLTGNLVWLNYAAINGSDLVLLILCFFAIPLSIRERIASEKHKIILILIYNLSLLLAQLQVVMIYWVSGLDKMRTETWLSGDAFLYIAHLDTMVDPAFARLLQNASANKVLSWLTILFEMLFGFGIWFPRFRWWMILAGTVFHLIIWWMLSLPDFALIMIVSYLLFISDEDIRSVNNVFRRSAT
jgi:hypothetical protein